MYAAAARMMEAAFRSDSHPATWAAADGTPSGVAVSVQMERAGPEEDTIFTAPVRSKRINAAIRAGVLPQALEQDDTFTFSSATPFEGVWRVDSVPMRTGEDDPAGLLIRFELAPA